MASDDVFKLKNEVADSEKFFSHIDGMFLNIIFFKILMGVLMCYIHHFPRFFCTLDTF